MNRTNEAAFEPVIEAHLLQNGHAPIAGDSFDRERAIFPETVLAFIRETQPKEWAKLGTIRSAAERAIALLEEHRTAPIGAGAAGRLDVGRIPESGGGATKENTC